MNLFFTRRRLLVASSALVSANIAGAQQASQRTKGPLAPLDLDQADVDDAYDVVKVSPNLPLVTRRWATNSDLARARIGEPRRFAYGPTPIEMLDVNATSRQNAPVHILIHGGGFNMGTARSYAFPAEMFVRAGAHFVVPDFSRASDHGGSPSPLLDQARRAVAWVRGNAASFGSDPVVVAVGSLETEWFKRRAREFAAAVQAAGGSARLLLADGYNHFEVIETLANPYGALGRAALQQMGIWTAWIRESGSRGNPPARRTALAPRPNPTARSRR